MSARAKARLARQAAHDPDAYAEFPADMDRPRDHDARMDAARRAAQWHLGDPSWAGEIIGAYLYPRGAMYALDLDEQGP